MDVDPAEIGKNKSVDVAVVGDVKSSLRTLVKMLSKKIVKKSEDNPWLKRRERTYRSLYGKYKRLSKRFDG